MTCTIYAHRPESRGWNHIRSRDPREAPSMRFNALSDSLDRNVLVDGVRWVRCMRREGRHIIGGG